MLARPNCWPLADFGLTIGDRQTDGKTRYLRGLRPMLLYPVPPDI